MSSSAGMCRSESKNPSSGGNDELGGVYGCPARVGPARAGLSRECRCSGAWRDARGMAGATVQLERRAPSRKRRCLESLVGSRESWRGRDTTTLWRIPGRVDAQPRELRAIAARERPSQAGALTAGMPHEHAQRSSSCTRKRCCSRALRQGRGVAAAMPCLRPPSCSTIL